MMSIPSEYESLLDDLIRVTTSGGLQWKPSKAGSAALELGFKEATIRMWEYYLDAIEEAGYGLELRNNAGVRVDYFSVNESDEGYTKLAGLYNSARRSAYKVNQLISKLESEIKEAENDIPF